MSEEDGPALEIIRQSKTSESTATQFSTFVYAVFVAIVMGAGWTVWNLVTANAILDKRVTLLEWKCARQAGVP